MRGSPGAADRPNRFVDRLARRADRLLRAAGDARLGLALLLLTGAANAVAAALPNGGLLLASPPYLVLLGAVLASGIAAVAVRAPPVWREWRHPAPPPDAPGTLVEELVLEGPMLPAARERLSRALRTAGYRVQESGGGERWAIAGSRRGWSRFAALGSHLALVVLIVGAAVGYAFGSETTFSLLPGEQAPLDEPAPGRTAAVRLDRFDAAFGADGRPRRLDATVTFLEAGVAVGQQLVRVNQPGAWGEYLLHAWTYGPAARVRVTSLGGRPLLDAPVALDGTLDGRPAAVVELPTAGLRLGLVLTNAAANRLAVSAGGQGGVVDAAELRPGEERRIGSLVVRLDGFDAYVTFLSRRDPGMGLVFGGAAALSGTLAIGLWLPRRRVGLRPVPAGLRIALRGERFDQPQRELARLREALGRAVAAPRVSRP